MIALALALACPRPTPPASTPGEVGAVAGPTPAGVVEGGRFRDHERGFQIVVPEGWMAEIGSAGDDERLRLKHVATGAALRVAVYIEAGVTRRARPDCHWGFEEEDVPSPLRLDQPVAVASCAPFEVGAPRVMGWYVERPPMAYHLELSLPAGYLARGQDAGAEALAGFTLE